MDSESKINTLKTGVGSGIMSPNEARKRMNLKPVAGGDSVFLQQQNYSLEALSKRDSQDDAFATKTVNTTTNTNNNTVKSTSESTNKNFNDDEDVTEYMLSFLREQ
jgi:phage portal protein BeeE